MKLGLNSAILGEFTFEEMIDFLERAGLECVEIACWPEGKANRRYAGVSHINVVDLTEEKAEYIKEYCGKHHVEISALAYYPNMLDPDLEKREFYINHLNKVMKAAKMLGVKTVTTFIGRIPDKDVESNLKEAVSVWRPILEYAEKENILISIENCPMLFTNDEWPGGQNIMTSPENWRRVFEVLDSSNLGLNYDPSHFVWQQMDYIAPIYEFKDKIFHVHFKDIKILAEKLKDVGIMAPPLEYMIPKIPGLGDIDWGKFVSALTDIEYDGYACIEVEDKAFEKKEGDVQKAILQSMKYLRNFVN